MLKRTPMARTGFKRSEKAVGVRPERVTQWPVAQSGRAFAAIKTIADFRPAQPKHAYIRSPKLLAAVRKLPCQHCTWPVGVEASHSNQGCHGKGRSIKADDNRIAALCHDCHAAVDQSSKLSRAERLTVWNSAHVKTVQALLAAGTWPAGVPVPDIETTT